MQTDIGAVLSRAYETVIKNRVLWALGLLAALLAGTGNSVNFRAGPGSNVQVFSWDFDLTPVLVAGVAGLALLFGIAVFLLRCLTDAALIAGGDRAAAGARPAFQEAWAAGRARFWPIVGLNLLFAACMVAFALVLALLVGLTIGGAVLIGLLTGQFTQGMSEAPRVVAAVGAGLAGLALLVVIAVPLAIALAMTTQLAQRAVVLDGQSIGQAWSTGWRLVRANPGSVLLTLLAQWLVMLVVGLVTFAVMAPFIFGPIVLLLGAGATPSFGAFAAAALLLGIAWALAAVVRALPEAWNSVLWTLFYRAVTVGLPATPTRPALFRGPLPPTVPGH